MELGTGIFLSAIVLGMLALFIATMDRWNWRKIIMRAIASLVGLAISIGLGVWGWTKYEQHGWEVLETRLIVQREFWDVAIGDNIKEVHFKKGLPKETVNDDKGITYKYDADDHTAMNLRFKDDKVRAVYAVSGRSSFLKLLGIDFGASAQTLTDKLGAGATVNSSADGIRRVYAFADYGVMFGLSKDGVEAMGIYDVAQPIPLVPMEQKEIDAKAFTPEQKRAIENAKERLRTQ